MRRVPLFLLLYVLSTRVAVAGLAITCGQSNANRTVADSFGKNLPGVTRSVTAMVGGQPIAVWVTPDGKGDFLRGPSYLTELWDPNPTAEAAVEKVCREMDHPDQIYFLWMQGESDSTTPADSEAYENKLRAFFRFVKEDFGFAKKFSLAIGLIWYSNLEKIKPLEEVRGVYRIRATQRKLAAELGAVWVDTASLNRIADLQLPPQDCVHLNYEGPTPGTKRFGTLAAQALRLQQHFHADEGVYLVQGAHELRGVRGVRYLLESSADGQKWHPLGSYLMPFVTGPETNSPQRLPWPATAGPDDLTLRYRITEERSVVMPYS